VEKAVSMTLEIRPLSEALGAEVIGVDLSKPIDEATFAEIHQAFLESLVLLFRGQHAMTVEQQMTFSRNLSCEAWNKLIDQPWKIMSIGLRDWAHGF
jgi:alpha-ketoglutarate-dependent taurine dioxygenase